MAHELQRAGWKKAVALKGGWQAWVDAGLPFGPLDEDASRIP